MWAAHFCAFGWDGPGSLCKIEIALEILNPEVRWLASTRATTVTGLKRKASYACMKSKLADSIKNGQRVSPSKESLQKQVSDWLASLLRFRGRDEAGWCDEAADIFGDGF
jgi:hypothetical protein